MVEFSYLFLDKDTELALWEAKFINFVYDLDLSTSSSEGFGPVTQTGLRLLEADISLIDFLLILEGIGIWIPKSGFIILLRLFF